MCIQLSCSLSQSKKVIDSWEEMTQLNKFSFCSWMMHFSSRAWWRKTDRLPDSWGAVCGWCRTRWDTSWYNQGFSPSLTFLSFNSVLFWNIYKLEALSVAVILWISCIYFFIFLPLSPTYLLYLSLKVSPSIAPSLYLRKTSQFFLFQYPVLPQSEVVMASCKGVGYKRFAASRVLAAKAI